MTGSELQAIRRRLKLSLVRFGLALGYSGADKNVQTTMRRYEADEKPIPPWIARLAIMFDRYGVPDDFRDEDERLPGTE
ncbi:helix-turn-helix transcriptional regulator [Hyphomicrobium sp. NDB2Meth4]|uniref:helix-turn-helix domain-containing protein n=1 Tax=Hyphomicrobium sp. NDB2Meth4 TaxID=1892846 RepID=UPI000930029A|nr:helix-turn-helix transcriptional regulator [Hyphomicrobium sp. NDB2Meth4]